MVYYDVFVQIWEDGEGFNYAVGQNFEDDSTETPPVFAHGTADTLSEALSAAKQAADELLSL